VHLRRAIALDPSYAPAHQWLGEVLYLNGRLDEALAELQTAATLDPLSPIVAMVTSFVYGIMGDTLRSDSVAGRAIELTPDAWPVHAFIGAAALESGRPERAIVFLERADAMAGGLPPAFRGLLAFAYASRGDRAKAIAIRDALLAETPQSAVALAEVYAGLGERDRALDMLERALAEQEPYLFAASISPRWYAGLRAEPRFAALAAAMNLDPRALTE
jgi:superkiller protein 3